METEEDGQDDSILFSLPEDKIVLICEFLTGKDIANFMLTCRKSNRIANETSVWRSIVRTEYSDKRDFLLTPLRMSGVLTNSTESISAEDEIENYKEWKELYKRNRKLETLNKAFWNRNNKLNILPNQAGHEGHAVTLAGNYLVLFGGFLRSSHIYVADIRNLTTQTDDSKNNNDGNIDNIKEKIKGQNVEWKKVISKGECPHFVYGHSLTAISNNEVVLFAGLTMGGYQGESNHLFRIKLQFNEGNDNSQPITAEWVKLTLPNTPHPRGYHSAVFIPKENHFSSLFEHPFHNNNNNNNNVHFHHPNYQNNEQNAQEETKVEWKSNHDWIIFFGGICRRGGSSNLALLELGEEWKWISLVTDGENPTWRWGNSSCLIGSKLYIIGGCRGFDLLRDGIDLNDIYQLDLSKDIPYWKLLDVKYNNPNDGPNVYIDKETNINEGDDEDDEDGADEEMEDDAEDNKDSLIVDNTNIINNSVNSNNNDDKIEEQNNQEKELVEVPTTLVGRCHTATSIGNKIILFGGSLHIHNLVTVFDTERLIIYKPIIEGWCPCPRISHTATFIQSRSSIIITGGFDYENGALYDCHELCVCIGDEKDVPMDASSDLLVQEKEELLNYGYHPKFRMKGGEEENMDDNEIIYTNSRCLIS